MTTAVKALAANFKTFAVLKLSPQTPDLKDKYIPLVQKHNQSLFTDPFPNSGFDLLVPSATSILTGMRTEMISMDVKCEMLHMGEDSCGYHMFPRSSISKTSLMLANHTGIIDAGYRGPLIGAFRNLGQRDHEVDADTRLLQVCHPTLCPIYVEIVEESELSTTSRGEGGFGSTGK